MLPKSRKEAIAVGSMRYETGIPCKNGHISPRRTLTMNCDACITLYRRRAAQRLNEKMALEARGVVPVTLHVESECVPLVRTFEAMLNKCSLYPELEKETNAIKIFVDYANSVMEWLDAVHKTRV